MREIKFRGISEDEWAYGLLKKVDEWEVMDNEKFNYLIQTDKKVEGEYDEYFITDDSSIGQYIGLKDKNRKEIYEGDIVKITYSDGSFEIGVIKYFERDIRYMLEINKNAWGLIGKNNLEVIGNIHDNPELLKEE